MARDKVRNVLRSAARDPETLQALRDDPGTLKERFSLDDQDVVALRRADLLLVGAFPTDAVQTISPITITGGTGQTTSPITITVITGQAFDSEEPVLSFPLEEMDSEQLAAILHRVLVDPQFAARVREQLEP